MGYDVGTHSVCSEYVLLPLVKKESALAYGRSEYSKAGNPSNEKGCKQEESGRCHVARKGGQQNLTRKAQPHSNTQINRN